MWKNLQIGSYKVDEEKLQTKWLIKENYNMADKRSNQVQDGRNESMCSVVPGVERWLVP